MFLLLKKWRHIAKNLSSFFFIFFLYGKRLCTAESLYKFCVIEKDKKGE
ncbi:hypothetical protein BACIH_0322 [Bacillus amyloliquefaciens]|nr:hypothetical protein U471_03490 [Bacillus amyloliquefaciens CC178]KYC87490.1 hypothetical protein B4140_0623 [Bacillus amyloliquefaciens]QEY89309.1 hypothetical protein BACIT_1382 [Bacillus amyloliquefaciens]QEY92114.1 hypothetical protein BACIH_0322 [Bacillus amyloliquefaciens]